MSEQTIVQCDVPGCKVTSEQETVQTLLLRDGWLWHEATKYEEVLYTRVDLCPNHLLALVHNLMAGWGDTTITADDAVKVWLLVNWKATSVHFREVPERVHQALAQEVA